MFRSLSILSVVCIAQAAGGAGPFEFRQISPTGPGTVRRRQAGVRLQLRHGAGQGLPGGDAAIVLSAPGLRPGRHRADRRFQSRPSAPPRHLLDVAGGDGGRQEGRHLDASRDFSSGSWAGRPAKPTARRPGWRSRTAGSTASGSSSRRMSRSSPTPAVEGRRLLEFTLRFEAVDRPVQIAGTPEGKKGFGGFCFRFAPATAAARRRSFAPIRASRRRTACWPAHPWAEISGTFQGKPAGARVEDMPAEPRLSQQRLALAARLRLPERLLSGPGADHAGARQAAGAEVPRHPLRRSAACSAARQAVA